MKNVISLFTKNLVNVAKKTAEAFHNIFMYLYNKNIIEYAQIARNGPKAMIIDIEGHSSFYPLHKYKYQKRQASE